MQVGSLYSFPPQQTGLLPSSDESAASWQSNVTRAARLSADERGGDLSKATLISGMTRAYVGLSGSLVKELAAIAGVAESEAPEGLTPLQWDALWQAWRTWLDRLEGGTFAATRDPDSGRCSVLGSFSEPFDSVHSMIDASYRYASTSNYNSDDVSLSSPQILITLLFVYMTTCIW